jgi:predicted nucleic acid-binding Zn ribbon protein
MAAVIGRRGFALLLVLSTVVILTMMLTGLFVAVGGPAVAGLKSGRQTAGLYVAEAGLQEALFELEQNRGFSGTISRVLSGGTGNFTVNFGPGESVNNLTGTAPKPSHRGTNTVPAYTALVVVHATVGGQQQRLEALVCDGEALPKDTALLSGGGTGLQGNISISGTESFQDSTSVSVDVHSNQPSGTNLLTWSGASGQTAFFDGDLSTVGATAGAILLSGAATITGEQQLGAARRKLPTFDIPAAIAGKTGAAAPSFPPFGVSTLAPGEYYHSGDLELHGDLDLDGAKLYVSGNLKINGAVRGKGAVFVQGETALRGDSEVTAHDSHGIALLSHGDVTLGGFDGNAYLGAVAASDSSFAESWHAASETLKELKTLLGAADRDEPGEWKGVTQQQFQLVLGPWGSAQTSGTFRNYERDAIGNMATKLAGLPADPDPERESTRTFLTKRMQAIGHIFKGGGMHYNNDHGGRVDDFLQNGDPGALFDVAVGQANTGNADERRKAELAFVGFRTLMQHIEWDKLGRSYFQGLVYSDGDFHASNDVTLLGAMAVAGDIHLDSGVHVSYVKSMFEPGGVMTWTGRVRVVSWLSRE